MDRDYKIEPGAKTREIFDQNALVKVIKCVNDKKILIKATATNLSTKYYISSMS